MTTKKQESSKQTSKTYRDKMVGEGRKELRVWVHAKDYEYIKRSTNRLKQELEK